MASSSAQHHLEARGQRGVDQRVDRASDKERLVKKLREIVEADEGRFGRLQRVRLKKSEAKLGSRNSVPKTTAAGR